MILGCTDAAATVQLLAVPHSTYSRRDVLTEERNKLAALIAVKVKQAEKKRAAATAASDETSRTAARTDSGATDSGHC